MSWRTASNNFEAAAATMASRSSSLEEKRKASKMFLKYFVSYLALLAVLGIGASAIVQRLGSASSLGLVLAVACSAMAFALMIVFTRSAIRSLWASMRRDG